MIIFHLETSRRKIALKKVRNEFRKEILKITNVLMKECKRNLLPHKLDEQEIEKNRNYGRVASIAYASGIFRSLSLNEIF